MLHLGAITLMPEMFGCLQYGITGRAIEQGLVRVDHWNPRAWSTKPHRHIDDKPYGGGPGMVMMYEPLHQAILHAKSQMPPHCKMVYLSPQGIRVKQSDLNQIVKHTQPILFLCGRYEGIDERVIAHHVDEEWSIGDFVLSGGELAAMIFIDALIRLIPGSLGHPESANLDSFMHGLLDYPHYTRPAVVNNTSVPEVLLNGNHRDIERWRRKQSLGRTWLKRPDLLAMSTLTNEDTQLLIEYQREYQEQNTEHEE